MGKRLHLPRTALAASPKVGSQPPLSSELLQRVARDTATARSQLEPGVFNTALQLIQGAPGPATRTPSRANRVQWQALASRAERAHPTASEATSPSADKPLEWNLEAFQAREARQRTAHWEAHIQRFGVASFAHRYEDLDDLQTQTAKAGEALHPVLLEALETHFQQRLPAISIHTDPAAAARTKAVGALAFTSGSSIHFSAGSYQPFTPEGFRLLVHETTHVLQQAKGIVPEGVDTDPSLEYAAQLEASRVTATPSPSAVTQPSSQPNSSQSNSSHSNFSQPIAPQLETPGQWAAHLLNTLKRHELPRERFTTAANLFAQVPSDQQGKTKALLLGKFNPNSSEYARLETSLIVTPGANTVRSPGSSRTEVRGRQAGAINLRWFLNPRERDLILPRHQAFQVSDTTDLKSSHALETPASSPPVRTARAKQAFRATHVTARGLQRQKANPSSEGQPIGKRAFVREDGLNLREKPDQKTRSLGTFSFGSKILVVSKTGEWYRVIADGGKSGYMLASKVHGLQPQHQTMLEQDPGLRLFHVRNGETGMQLVRRAYGISGAEGSKDQNLWHFLNVIRKHNRPEAFGFKDKGWGDAVQNFFIPGADANNVMLKADVDLWIPSFVKAAKDNTVGSGTFTGELVRLDKNIQQKVSDFQTARNYAASSIGPIFLKRLEQGAHELIDGLITSLLFAAGIMVTTTVIGAIAGAFAGGVGAAPGAAIGFQVGMWLLEWLGLGFLVVWGAGKLTQVFGALGTFVAKVWNANGDQKQLQEAGVALADALAILAVTALQILVTLAVAKGLGAATKGLANSRFGKSIGIPRLQAYLRLKLGKINRTAGSIPQTAKIQTGLKTTTPRAVVGRIRNRGKKEPPTETTPQRTSATQRAEIIKTLQEKYGKAVIDTLLRQCQDNVIWLKRFLEKFGTPYEVRKLLSACGDAPRLNKLLNAAESQGLGAKGVYDASSYYGKSLPEILKRSQSEVNAAVKLMKLEKADGGHAVTSHGPQVTDAQLKNRITTGVAPDGRILATNTSSRFDSFGEMLKAREYALSEVKRIYSSQGIDLSRPPPITLRPNARGEVLLDSHTIDLQPIFGRKSVGSGFTVDPSLRGRPTATNPTGTAVSVPGVRGNVYPISSVSPITTPVTSVRIGMKWNGKKWVVGQFFPNP